MAQVVLLSATPPHDETREHLAPLRDFRESAANDRFGIHRVTDDPEAADVIIFVESYGAGWHFERARRHPFTRRFREKCFIFCSNPFVIPFLPGVYTGIDKRWSSRRTVAGFYLDVPKSRFTTFTPPSDDLPYLYSFTGSVGTAPVRRELQTLQHPRGFFQDTAADFARALNGRMDVSEQRDYQRRYAEMTKASKVVLCPRGLSSSSIRLFETMRMGRAPVILSDAWVEPPEPEWDTFSVRVREGEWRRIPKILEEREGDAVGMGERARAAWLEWFSREVAFHRVVQACLGIRERRVLPEKLERLPVYLQYLRPFHFRKLVAGFARRVR
ncbi:MAG TPA: exostosin family protein [Chthoniobacterales bacterium]|nr:exostosin family protein [Chthoniobacterales bacterium]